MGDILIILLLSICMFVGSFLAGYIPLSISLSQRKVQLFTIFGAGLLVGTALCVIIPEGVETMYNSQHGKANEHSLQRESNDANENHGAVDEEKKPATKEVVFHLAEDDDKHSHTGVHKYIGVSLLVGFIFMLVLDHFSGSHGHTHSPDIKLDNLTQSKIGTAKQQQSSSKGLTATIGLVVHAAADGIAMGAASSTQRSDLQVIVFLAIMLHKAPAAFGLVSFLMHDGLEQRKIKRHLCLFSCAAPFTTILTYLALSSYSVGSVHDVNGTGIAMLFSAGTFLYVATVHVLPEISHQPSNSSHSAGLSSFEVFLLVLGCFFPLLLSLGHHH